MVSLPKDIKNNKKRTFSFEAFKEKERERKENKEKCRIFEK